MQNMIEQNWWIPQLRFCSMRAFSCSSHCHVVRSFWAHEDHSRSLGTRLWVVSSVICSWMFVVVLLWLFCVRLLFCKLSFLCCCLCYSAFCTRCFCLPIFLSVLAKPPYFSLFISPFLHLIITPFFFPHLSSIYLLKFIFYHLWVLFNWALNHIISAIVRDIFNGPLSNYRPSNHMVNTS